jgi:hypothetical protein
LARVRREHAVVDVVGDAIVVAVGVDVVRQAVAVGVSGIGEELEVAGLFNIQQAVAVAVVVEGVDGAVVVGVAGDAAGSLFAVEDGVAVGVGVPRVEADLDLQRVKEAVAVGVGVASVALEVAVDV